MKKFTCLISICFIIKSKPSVTEVLWYRQHTKRADISARSQGRMLFLMCYEDACNSSISKESLRMAVAPWLNEKKQFRYSRRS